MGKRKRHESELSGLETPNEHIKGNIKKKVKTETSSTDLLSDEYDVWLIKKPISVKPDCLSNLRFPRMGKRKSVALDLHSSEGAVLLCDFSPSMTQMLHVPASRVRTQKEAMNMKALSEVNGVCFISKFQSDESLGISDLDKNSWKSSLDIHSIRRKPVLRAEATKERLKAYGVVHKKKRKLPNLT